VDYRLLFSQRALDDFAEIIGHIAEDDPEAASRFGSSLLDHVDLLSRFPRMGDAMRKRSRVRKLLHSPILVYYIVARTSERWKCCISGMAPDGLPDFDLMSSAARLLTRCDH